MEIDKLIAEYKEQAAICAKTDYADKKSVRQNNKAVDRMYAIVTTIDRNFGPDGIVKFQELLDVKENNIDLWSATHLLERLKVETSIEEKALTIIETVAKGKGVEALGYQYWLKDWYEKRNAH
jgi:hypothetical protein